MSQSINSYAERFSQIEQEWLELQCPSEEQLKELTGITYSEFPDKTKEREKAESLSLLIQKRVIVNYHIDKAVSSLKEFPETLPPMYQNIDELRKLIDLRVIKANSDFYFNESYKLEGQKGLFLLAAEGCHEISKQMAIFMNAHSSTEAAIQSINPYVIEIIHKQRQLAQITLQQPSSDLLCQKIQFLFNQNLNYIKNFEQLISEHIQLVTLHFLNWIDSSFQSSFEDLSFFHQLCWTLCFLPHSGIAIIFSETLKHSHLTYEVIVSDTSSQSLRIYPNDNPSIGFQGLYAAK